MAKADAAAPIHPSHPDAPLTDTTFFAFTPKAVVDAAVPVLVFQSGFGSNAACHAPLLQEVADAGFVVVVPERESDTAGTPPNKEAPGILFSGKPSVAAISTHGRHLGATLGWVKKQAGSINGQKFDASNVVAGGFSMGCIEAIQFAAANEATCAGVILVSPSTAAMVEGPYMFSNADCNAKVAASKVPVLLVTSDKDLCLDEAKTLYEGATCAGSVYVEFKDSVLDLSMAMTAELSIWSPEAAEMFPGLDRHFALAAEAKVVSGKPMIAFLKKTTGAGGADLPFADPADATIKTK